MNKKSISTALFGFLLICQPLLTQTWSSRKRLTWTTNSSVFPVATAYSGGRIHLAWVEAVPPYTYGEIYYKRTTDYGTSWNLVKRLTWNSGESKFPAIIRDNLGRVYVFWLDDTPGNYELFYKKSMDGGVSWLSTKRMTFNSATMESPPFACVDSGNTIHLVYADTSYVKYQVFYRNSTDSGQNWSARQRVTWSSDSVIQPKIAVDSNNDVHIVLQDYNFGENPEVSYKKRLSNGTWLSPKRLTWHLQGSYYPFVAVDSADTVHLVWYSRKTGGPEIYYRKSTDGGTTWSAVKQLTWTGGMSMTPVIAADSNKDIHVVWYRSVDSQDEIYYKKNIFDVGWTGPQRLSWNSGWSESPYIVVDPNDDLHVFWHDNTPGDLEVFYKYYK